MEFKDLSKTIILPNDFSYLDASEIDNICPIISSLSSCNFMRLNGEIYHHKIKDDKVLLLNELVGEYISLYFELQTKRSIIAISEEDVCLNDSNFSLIAKSFFEEGLKYFYADGFRDMLFHDNVGLDNLERISNFYDASINRDIFVDSDDLKKMGEDLRKFIIRDFLTHQNDRGRQNFMFGYRDNHLKLMPIFDYEHSFSDYFKIYYNIFNFDLTLRKVREFIKNDNTFQKLLYRLMDFNLDYVLNRLEEDHNIILSDEECSRYNKVIKDKQLLVRKKKIII